MSNFWSDFFWNQVFPRLDLSLALQSFNPKDAGRHYVINCPGCGHRRAFCFKNSGQIKCNRENNCDWKGDVLNAFSNQTSLNSDDFVQSITELAKFANIDVPHANLTLEQVEQTQQKKKYLSLFDDVCERMKELLLGALEAVTYLENRGFGPIQFPFGYISNLKALELSNEQLIELGFKTENQNTDNWLQRIVLPIRDKRRKGVGFVGRSINGPSIRRDVPKYLNSIGLDFASLGAIGLDLSKSERAVLVEGGIFGFLQVRAADCDALGIGGNAGAITVDRWKKLYELGYREITIAPDDDNAGVKHLEKALNAQRDALPFAPRVYVLDPALYRGVKAPDEFITKYGGNEFREILRRRDTDMSFRAKLYAIGFDFTDVADVERYREKSLIFFDAISDSAERLRAEQFFLPLVGDAGGTSVAYLQAIGKERAVKRREADLAAAITDLNQDRNFEAIRKEIVNAQSAELGKFVLRPVRSADTETGDVERVLAEYAGKRHIGITQSALPGVDDSLSGYRGVTVLASRTNVGKTMFVIQQVLDILKTNDNVCAVFCSLEMEYWRIISRAWAHLGEINWDDMVMGSNRFTTPASPFSQDDMAKTAIGKRRFSRLGRRLCILDKTNQSSFSTDGILEADSRLKEETGCNRSMNVIDYLDVMDLPPDVLKERRTENEQQKWQMNQTLELRDRRNGDPVIAITEVRKGGRGEESDSPLTVDDVMGTARKAFAADAVMIYNPLTSIGYAQWFEENAIAAGGYNVRTEPDEIEITAKNRREIIKKGDKLKSICESLGVNYAHINVPKVRDAGRRAVIPITNCFRQSRFLEGFQSYDTISGGNNLSSQEKFWYDEADEDAVEF